MGRTNSAWKTAHGGKRVPYNDDGVDDSNTYYALFDLGDSDTEGSINYVVKETAILNGIDVTGYNGKWEIPTISNSKLKQDMLYGKNGTSRGTAPIDTLSFRGYPTPIIESVVVSASSAYSNTVFIYLKHKVPFAVHFKLIDIDGTDWDILGNTPAERMAAIDGHNLTDKYITIFAGHDYGHKEYTKSNYGVQPTNGYGNFSVHVEVALDTRDGFLVEPLYVECDLFADGLYANEDMWVEVYSNEFVGSCVCNSNSGAWYDRIFWGDNGEDTGSIIGKNKLYDAREGNMITNIGPVTDRSTHPHNEIQYMVLSDGTIRKATGAETCDIDFANQDCSGSGSSDDGSTQQPSNLVSWYSGYNGIRAFITGQLDVCNMIDGESKGTNVTLYKYKTNASVAVGDYVYKSNGQPADAGTYCQTGYSGGHEFVGMKVVVSNKKVTSIDTYPNRTECGGTGGGGHP